MDDVRLYPEPNPFITQWLAGPICRSILFEAAEMYKALYQEIVAKRTGRLARSARVYTSFVGDRWVATLQVGDATAFYGASHEFGTVGGLHPGDGAHDLNRALNMMAAL
ncbi:hypothetical protein ACFWPK_22395 [Nocardia sp. NPDC058519]|uniref:hypothetical protein n=1 Tax=Nocardia sp. NPDC058519 TaxID=3346535 RepID=UPI00365F241B